MDCKEFQYWLTTREIHDKQFPQKIRNHMDTCSQCRALFEEDHRLEQGIADAFAQEELPRGMEERISISLDHGRQHFFFRLTEKYRPGVLTGAGLAAGLIIAALIFTNFYPAPSPAFKTLNQITVQAVTDHLKGNRYMNFDTRETEQALDMLTQKLGFKVMLPDLKALGYTLMGGRLCALGDCRAAYFVMEHGGKTGSLYIMATDSIQFSMADGTRYTTSIKGCDTCVWKDHDQIYAMVF